MAPASSEKEALPSTKLGTSACACVSVCGRRERHQLGSYQFRLEGQTLLRVHGPQETHFLLAGLTRPNRTEQTKQGKPKTWLRSVTRHLRLSAIM